MCDISQGERCEVWEEDWRTARKEHRCDCCGLTIKAGVRYLRLFYVFDGQADAERACEPCEQERVRFAGVPGHVKPSPSSLGDYLSECIDEEPRTAIRWHAMLARISKRREAAKAVTP